jgi:murein DD-endopeptidase MepM/ murein hydrolase activator NlpD
LKKERKKYDMHKAKRLLRKLFTPVTIMLIPHDSKGTINFKLPSIGIICSVILWIVGSVYVVSIAVNTVEYHRMKSQLSFYSARFAQLESTIDNLKKAETEFERLLSFGTKNKILENVDNKVTAHDTGSIDMDLLQEQIRNTIENVDAIKDFLKAQKDIYVSTPRGWPIDGRVTSEFGPRENPKDGSPEFHSGIDISAPSETPVRATADGIVSFAGWSKGSGNLVVVEHGFSYSTCYAHNTSIAVSVGKKVRRGDIISYSGSTGDSTGPHLHYEVRHNGKALNPREFIMEARYVHKEK